MVPEVGAVGKCGFPPILCSFCAPLEAAVVDSKEQNFSTNACKSIYSGSVDYDGFFSDY